MNTVLGTVTADRPLRKYADKEMGLIWPKAHFYCFGDIILVQDLNYVSVSIYFMDNTICEESNYWTQKLNQRFLPYFMLGQCSFFMVLETPKNMLFSGGIENEQWPEMHFKAFFLCALNTDALSISD